MTMRILRARDLVRTSWKNGGGTTAEIAASPAGAGLDSFDWRLSMADIGIDGPFSLFPGVDRTLVLIEGRDLELAVGESVHRLDKPLSMLSFAGESVVSARLLASPVRDLNVMTRRGRCCHALTALRAGPLEWDAPVPQVVALAATRESLIVQTGGEDHRLARFDVLVGPPPSRLVLDGPALLVSLWESVRPR